jgi:3-oxoadipate CoA-transferase, alpha subunit
MNKIIRSAADAVADIPDGATILLGGFGDVGVAWNLIDALADQGTKNLVLISNNCGTTEVGIARLLKQGQVRKMIASFPSQVNGYVFEQLYREGKVELELVPQGTLAERIRAAGAGIGGFYVPVGVDTLLEVGKEKRELGGKTHLLEYPIFGDYAFVKAHKADRWGNLVYRKSGRNFNPMMATAAKITIAEAEKIFDVGELDPEEIITPGIFVKRVVQFAGGSHAQINKRANGNTDR